MCIGVYLQMYDLLICAYVFICGYMVYRDVPMWCALRVHEDVVCWADSRVPRYIHEAHMHISKPYMSIKSTFSGADICILCRYLTRRGRGRSFSRKRMVMTSMLRVCRGARV